MQARSKPRLLLALTVATVLGLAAGIGAVTFLYAEGASYLGSDPKACANCHIMDEQYDGWTRSSHHAVATCNDCHAPGTPVAKLWVKAQNGFWHSWAFTTGRFHEPIRMTKRNRVVTEQRCRDCHAAVVDQIDSPHGTGEQMACIRCHWNAGHLH